MGWRYLAQRLAGEAAGEFIDVEVPLSDVALTPAPLSAPADLTAQISPEYARLRGPDGRPLLDEWGTAIWAEADGQIRGGGILVHSGFDGPTWRLECMGYAGYPTGIPYDGHYRQVGVDPLEVVRHVWGHVQDQPDAALGVTVDAAVSPVRVGTADEPFELAWWEAPDCGRTIDDLARQVPFDYREAHAWNADRTDVTHRIDLGHPRLGRRRNDLRFVLGENLAETPGAEHDGDGFANEVLVLGTGQGRAKVRASVPRRDGRLRRVHVHTDEALTTTAAATSTARALLGLRSQLLDVAEVTVLDHPNAPIGAWADGDEVLVQADTGWRDVQLWCRVLATTIRPEQAGAATLRLARADAAAA